VRLLLADSNELIRVGLKSTLSGLAEVHSIIEISNGKQLIDVAQQGGMAVVLIDYTAEGFDIDDVIASLRLNPSLKFIGLTYLQSPQTLVDALRGGVMSYIKKDCDLQEISDAVIDHGLLTCDPVLMSDRENEIIVLIAEGYTNDQIAEMLFLSKHTVNTHRKNILFKLGVKNTAGIVMYAVKTQLVSPNKFLFAAN
jgi:DNA-binding NarL/FixJ family response regulator